MISHASLLKPVITEKSFERAKNGWYTFILERKMDKARARKIIEEVFKVKVEGIKNVTIKGKVKKSLRTKSLIKKSDFKKFLVKLGKDQKIDIFESGGK